MKKKINTTASHQARFQQWKTLKENYKTSILLLRAVNVYHAYEEDGRTITYNLNIHPQDLPGKPVIIELQDLDRLLFTLVPAGYQVAVAEQL